MRVEIPHPQLGPQKTYLTADVAAAASSSTVENYAGFATDDFAIFGSLGNEKTEAVALTGVTASTTLGHTTGPVFAHSADTTVSQVKYNQVEISHATAEDGTYSVAATVSLTFDQDQTEYYHSAGLITTWYKVRYKNSATSSYSSFSGQIKGTGFESDSLGGIVERVLDELEDPTGKTYSKKRIWRVANLAVRKLTLALSKLHLTVLTTYATDTLTAATQMYDLPARFLRFKKLEIAYDGSTYKRVRFESESDGLPDTDYYTDSPRAFRRGGQYGLRPYSTLTGSSTYKMWYDAYPATMDEEDDVHGLPYGAEDAIIPFIIYRMRAGKSEDNATGYLREYQEARNDWLEMVSEGFQDYQPSVLRIRTDYDLYGSELVGW